MSLTFGPNGVCDEYRIVQEANHRFANHLALLSDFVRLKATDLARRPVAPTIAGVQLLLESVRAQIEAIAHLNRTLALTLPPEAESFY
jgi:two-component sensor histidine kinase